jgi:hypothetical protein
VTQKPDAVLAAEELTLKANGTVGDVSVLAPVEPVTDREGRVVGLKKPDGAVSVNADKADIESSGANIHSIAPNTELSLVGKNGIQLTALGNLTPGEKNLLDGMQLLLTALGNIGTPRNRFTYPNGAKLISLLSYYGLTNVEMLPGGYGLTFLKHLLGGAVGFIPGSAVLEIGELTLRGNSADGLLDLAAKSEGALVAANVAIRDGGRFFGGRVMLMLRAEETTRGMANGETVYVIHSKGDGVELIRGFVWEGYVVFFTEGLDRSGESGFVALSAEALAALGLEASSFKPGVLYPFGEEYFTVDVYRTAPGWMDYFTEQLELFREQPMAA